MKDVVVGLNYSAFHDSSIAVFDLDGCLVFATSLERFSRKKQDSRRPTELFAFVEQKWNITKVYTSTLESDVKLQLTQSNLNHSKLKSARSNILRHPIVWDTYFQDLPYETSFVEHQVSHALSGYFFSELESAFIFTYDGGMANSPNFSGLFHVSQFGQLQQLDCMDSRLYPKISSLYTIVTALLGFTGNRHEGKVTGLAAYGSVSKDILVILDRWYRQEFEEAEGLLEWFGHYDERLVASLNLKSEEALSFVNEVRRFRREDFAASLQFFLEDYIIVMLKQYQKKFDISLSETLILSGGIFQNVKLNLAIKKLGFSSLLVTPPMGDEGTAIGSAYSHFFNDSKGKQPICARKRVLPYFGREYSADLIISALDNFGCNYELYADEVSENSTVMKVLLEGGVVACFQGASEFGPRALGNRSIIASARNEQINQQLNLKLNRSEFMPFAPIIADFLFNLVIKDGNFHIDELRHMVLACDASEKMKEEAPAAVHVDGTFRPQFIDHESNPAIFSILKNIWEERGEVCLINTSFNVHEEPIVDSPLDAIRAFLFSGLELLWFPGIAMVQLSENAEQRIAFLRSAYMMRVNADELKDMSVKLEIALETGNKWKSLAIEKEIVIQQLIQNGN